MSNTCARPYSSPPLTIGVAVRIICSPLVHRRVSQARQHVFPHASDFLHFVLRPTPSALLSQLSELYLHRHHSRNCGLVHKRTGIIRLSWGGDDLSFSFVARFNLPFFKPSMCFNKELLTNLPLYIWAPNIVVIVHNRAMKN